MAEEVVLSGYPPNRINNPQNAATSQLLRRVLGAVLYHWAEDYYITSRYFSELIMSDVMESVTSIMVCESMSWQCNSGRRLPGCLPGAWITKITLHQSLGMSY